MRIAITGVPGTGKTTLAKILSSRFGYDYIDVAKIVREYRLGTSVDIDRLQTILKQILRSRNNYVIESHLLAELDMDFDITIITRASYRALLRRYARRRYSKRKIWENIAAELLDYFPIKLENKRFIQIDTTGLSTRELERKAIKYIQLGISDDIDWSNDLFRLVIRGKI